MTSRRYLIGLIFMMSSLPFLIGMSSVEDTALYVKSVHPMPDSQNVSKDGVIHVVFDRPVVVYDINDLTIRLSDGDGYLPGKVNYYPDSKKAVFEPMERLKAGVRYTAVVEAGIRGEDGSWMAIPKTWNFKTKGDLHHNAVRPFITGVTPDLEAVDQSLDRSIMIAFSTRIDEKFLNDRYISIKGPDGYVHTTMKYDSNTDLLKVKADELFEYDSLYRVTVSGLTADAHGNNIGLDYTWYFKTLPAPVKVKQILPLNGSAKVPVTSQILVELTGYLDPARVRNDSVIVRDPLGSPVPGILRYVHADKRLIFVPDHLYNETVYTIEVNSLSEDRFGRPLEPAVSSFKTLDIIPPRVVRTLPADGEKAVPLDAKIIVQFSEIIDASTLHERNFVVTDGDGIIKGDISFNPATATMTFRAESPFERGVGYRVNMTTDIRDIDGNAILNPVVWGFWTLPYDPEEIAMRLASYSAEDEARALSTAQQIMGKDFYEHLVKEERIVEDIIVDEIPPEAMDVYPVENQFAVPTNTEIAVVFSEPVDPETLVSPDNIYLKVMQDDGEISGGMIDYDRSTGRMILVPDEELKPLTDYMVRLRNGIRDIQGNMLKEKEWTFITGESRMSKIVAVVPEKPEEPIFSLEEMEIHEAEEFMDAGPQPFFGTREILTIGEGDIYSAPAVEVTRKEWAYRLIGELSSRFDRRGPIKIHSRSMIASRHELAMILKRILAKMERGWLDYLYKSKEGVASLILIEQAICEFREELTMVGVNPEVFERRLEASGIPVENIRNDMEIGIIKGIQAKSKMANISPIILVKMRAEMDEVAKMLDDARIRMIRIPEHHFPEKAIYQGKLSRAVRLAMIIRDNAETDTRFDALKHRVIELHEILDSLRGYFGTIEPGPVAGEMSFFPEYMTQAEARLSKVENTIEYYSGKLFDDLSLYSDRLGEADTVLRDVVRTLANTEVKYMDRNAQVILRRSRDLTRRLQDIRMHLPDSTGMIFNDSLIRTYSTELDRVSGELSSIGLQIEAIENPVLKERVSSYPPRIAGLLQTFESLQSRVRTRIHVMEREMTEREYIR